MTKRFQLALVFTTALTAAGQAHSQCGVDFAEPCGGDTTITNQNQIDLGVGVDVDADLYSSTHNNNHNNNHLHNNTHVDFDPTISIDNGGDVYNAGDNHLSTGDQTIRNDVGRTYSL